MHPVSYWRGPAFRALAVFLLALAALAGCTMVSDLTGLSLSKKARGTCISDCSSVANLAIQEELQQHQDHIAACLSLPTAERDACMAEEGARHAAAMQAIQASRLECLNNCHNQGQGSAG